MEAEQREKVVSGGMRGKAGKLIEHIVKFSTKRGTSETRTAAATMAHV
jgi:hypothetical protein